jgi:recombinational DNA repair protein (RecF pathway)
MYEKTITQGLVLHKRGVGEANTLAFILTPDLGLVRARAQSARREASKLRYGIEPLTLGRYTFVRGAHEWRLTGVDDLERIPTSPMAGRIIRLLLRLVQGQEPNERLYSDVVAGLVLPSSAEAEAVLVLRILSHLGYLPHTEALAPYIDADISPELSVRAMQDRALLIRTINESLRATGL